jgi:hypothetical protein
LSAVCCGSIFLQETTVKGCNHAAQRHVTRVEIANELTEDMNEIQYRGKVFKKIILLIKIAHGRMTPWQLLMRLANIKRYVRIIKFNFLMTI